MTNNLNITGLNPAVADKITPMVEDLLGEHASNIHSFHLVGSAVIPDYHEKLSDINSVVVLHNMDLRFIKFLAPLGKKYGKKRIAAPLVMTPEYIKTSLDAFPIEFLDFKLIHKTVYGHDLLQDLPHHLAQEIRLVGGQAHPTLRRAASAASAAWRTSPSLPARYTRPVAPIIR